MAKGCFIPEWPLKELSVKTIFYQDFVILLDFFFFFHSSKGSRCFWEEQGTCSRISNNATLGQGPATKSFRI